jgi:hypothetical protein
MTTQRRGDSDGTGLISRVAARLARSGPGRQDDALMDVDARARGATPIVDLVDRSQATVGGTVRSVRQRPRANVPALVAEIYDGSQRLNLIWLGRRRIGGVVPGIYLSAHGRVTFSHGIPTIFNPAYEIRPERGR